MFVILGVCLIARANKGGTCLTCPSVASGLFYFQISAMLCGQSSTETPFVRTHVAIYFISLLICNLVQGVGALLNIPWILNRRVYIGPLCTAQAAIKQFGNVWAFCNQRRRLNIDAIHDLRLEQQFSLLQSPPTLSVYSFFVADGRIGRATSSSWPRGLSSCSTCVSKFSLSRTQWRTDRTTESPATGAGSHPHTRQRDIPQSISSCSPQLGYPLSFIFLYSSYFAATSLSRLDARCTSINDPNSRSVEQVVGPTYPQMTDVLSRS